jgi:hypothetical protein
MPALMRTDPRHRKAAAGGMTSLRDADTIQSPWHEPQLDSKCASEIAIEPVEFIWPGRLALGKHTCWAGEPGASKSTLTMYVAATERGGWRS